MESYIEVSFLHNVMTMILSSLLGEYVAAQPISLGRITVYAVLISAFAVGSWYPYSFITLLVMEVVSFFFFFRYAYKTYGCALIFRLLFYASAFLFYQGGFHNGIYFVPMHSNIVSLWFVYALMFLLLFIKWKDIFSKLSYVYEVQFILESKKMRMKAYLDSGNLISYKDTPVLFVDKKYHEYFKNERIELIVMNSVTSMDVLRCYECEIKMAGCKKHKVYINADRHLQLPFQCVVLLNMKLMTMG